MTSHIHCKIDDPYEKMPHIWISEGDLESGKAHKREAKSIHQMKGVSLLPSTLDFDAALTIVF